MAKQTLAALKKASKTNFDQINQEIEKMTKTSGAETDARFWEPTVDKNGNGYAVIRFLPAPRNEDTPVVRYYEHAFQGPGGWYIEKSLTSLGKDDPVSVYNGKLWATGLAENKAFVRGVSGKPGSKRNVRYVSNIQVIEDAAHPENNGKVFLYKFGTKIFEKIKMAMNPEFGEEPINPYDFWTGANFKLKIRKYEGYRNYDLSGFSDQPSAIADSDEEIEKIWDSQYSLQEFVDPAKYKSYEELDVRLRRVMNLDSAGEQTGAGPAVAAAEPKQSTAPRQQSAVGQTDQEFEIDAGGDDDDDVNSFFAKIAADSD